MDHKAIRTEDQRLERVRLIEYNRQQRTEKRNDDENTLKMIHRQIIVFRLSMLIYFLILFFLPLRFDPVDF
jgi:hypothetical protein